MVEENIVYDVILRPGSARERHEIARFIEELMPLRRTQAFTCARRYLWATGHTVAINGWSPLPYPGPRILGYRVDGGLVCVDCGLTRLEPHRAAIVAMIRAGTMQRVCTTDGRLLHCHTCGRAILSARLPPLPRHAGVAPDRVHGVRGPHAVGQRYPGAG